MKSKLSGIAEQVEKKEMPLKSYLLLHTSAELSAVQIKIIKDGTESAKAEVDRYR